MIYTMRKTLYFLLLIGMSAHIQVAIAVGEEMSKANPPTLHEAHRDFAKQTNGRAWELLQRENLSDEEKDELLYAAYASAYHWLNAGTVVNRQRGEWLISRAYSKLGNGSMALNHAKECLALTDSNNPEFQNFDLAYALEAMARAHALLHNTMEATKFYRQAIAASNSIAKEEDRTLFLNDLRDGNWNAFRFQE